MGKNWIKYLIGFAVCFAIRLVPLRPPNVEPVMASLMPFSKKYGYLGGFAFAFLSIALFDVFTAKVGIWTLVTALTYGVVGLSAAFFFRKRKNSIFNYAGFAIIGTLFFDAVTLTIGPLFYGQPWIEAIVGQIQFTALHLIGNVALSILMSPFLYSWVLDNRFLDTDVFFVKFVKMVNS